MAAREEAWEGAQGGKGGGGAGQGISGGVVCSLSVCLSVVCPFLDELVRAALADCDETFGGGQGHGQERLSPEPAQSVKVRPRKGREIQILAVSPFEKAVVLASFSALYGWQVVPNAIWWCQVVTGWSLGAARGLSGGYRAQTEGFRKFGKRCFLPPGAKRGGLGGILPPILGRTGPGV